MYSNEINKYRIRQQALLDAIEFCGGVGVFSDRLKVSRTRASNWRNKPEINIPYEYVVLIEAITGVSIERLSPFTEAANEALRCLPVVDKLPPIEVLLNEIIVHRYPYTKYFNPDRSIIIGTDKVLISGLAQLECLKDAKLKKAIVTVLDLESMLLGVRTLKDFCFNFLISEKVSIGWRFEQLILTHLERYKKLGVTPLFEVKIEHLSKHDEVKKIYGGDIAHMIGFANQSLYQHAMTVSLRGVSNLIQRVDQEQLSLSEAAKIASLSPKEQNEHIKALEDEVLTMY